MVGVAAGHTLWHIAAMQTSADAHAASHAPQCPLSVAVSTQTPLQFVRAPQSVPQTPDEHTRPAPHTFAQAPQLSGELEVSTHLPPQSLSPAAQVPESLPEGPESTPIGGPESIPPPPEAHPVRTNARRALRASHRIMP